MFRSRPPVDLEKQLSDLIRARRLVTTAPVRLEVLLGARSEESYRMIQNRLAALPELPVGGDLWDQAAEMGHRLTRRGLSVAGMDLLIATVALAHDCALLHLDSDFDRMRSVMPLSIETPAWTPPGMR